MGEPFGLITPGVTPACRETQGSVGGIVPGGVHVSDVLVRIDPRFAPEHAAYYLRGLRQHTGVETLPFTKEDFPVDYEENRPLALVLSRGDVERRIYIAADDMAEIDHSALKWADVYGKVNLAPELIPPGYESKVVPIGPSHALRIWGLSESLRVARRTARAGGRYVGAREHYRRYWILNRRRLGDEDYEPGTSEDRYVFYNAWLWAKHRDVNPPRAEFMRACRDLSPIVEFEGGFIARRRNDVPEYDDLMADRHYSLRDYLHRIKRSTLVFNNPAVHQCHGWKLGEYLRLGKAMVSLPLTREMPAPLVHGEHIHIVSDSREAMQEAIRTIVNDPEYRRHLERSARAYYLQYLAPRRVIERVADIAFGGRSVGSGGGAQVAEQRRQAEVAADSVEPE